MKAMQEMNPRKGGGTDLLLVGVAQDLDAAEIHGAFQSFLLILVLLLAFAAFFTDAETAA